MDTYENERSQKFKFLGGKKEFVFTRNYWFACDSVNFCGSYWLAVKNYVDSSSCRVMEPLSIFVAVRKS